MQSSNKELNNIIGELDNIFESCYFKLEKQVDELMNLFKTGSEFSKIGPKIEAIFDSIIEKFQFDGWEFSEYKLKQENKVMFSKTIGVNTFYYASRVEGFGYLMIKHQTGEAVATLGEYFPPFITAGNVMQSLMQLISILSLEGKL